jgi:ketosteroid isomerase-like protein
MRRYYRQWEESFDGVSTEIEELIVSGDEVVAAVRAAGRMMGSDAEVEIHYAIVLSFRDGKIIKGREYFSREEALEAAGLSE